MMRVIKQKVKDSSDEPESFVGATKAARGEGPLVTFTGGVVVSNMPRNVSVAGSSVAQSSNSSLSSEGCLQGDFNNRFDDKDLALAMCKVPQSIVLPIVSSTSGVKRTKTSLSRKVSDVDVRIKAVPVVSPACKKRRLSRPVSPVPPFRLLAMPEDSSVLNPVHVFVRQQIEVFAATQVDIAQPSPGRKNPIRLGQVGLRCIHCRHMHVRDRVKRAICYPSSVGRIYNSVSDMKFDHFSVCRGFSPELRAKFNALKAKGNVRSDRRSGPASSTAQYYHDSALRFGMMDQNGGIFLPRGGIQLQPRSVESHPSRRGDSAPTPPVIKPSAFNSCRPIRIATAAESIKPLTLRAPVTYHAQLVAIYQRPKSLPSSNPAEITSNLALVVPKQAATVPVPPVVRSMGPNGKMLLAADTDEQYLNPLHCFVRRNVEVFAAKSEDIAAPSPGRKTRVLMGQVGLRCVHCAHLPAKDRVKRAVCYPPSVSGIYHSVSNMKFDHFRACRGLPEDTRAEFNRLRASCNRRGGCTSNGAKGMSNSTAQYYHDSALRLGLVDSRMGIRLRETTTPVPANAVTKPAKTSPTNVSDGISALMMAATSHDVHRRNTPQS